MPWGLEHQPLVHLPFKTRAGQCICMAGVVALAQTARGLCSVHIPRGKSPGRGQKVRGVLGRGCFWFRFRGCVQVSRTVCCGRRRKPRPPRPTLPPQAPRGCSCQVVGSNEPLSHPGALPSCQGAGLAPKVLHGSWELAGIADGPASPWWRLPTSPRVQASWPRTYQTALARRRSLGHPAPPTPWLTRARSLLGVPAVFMTETPLVDMRSCS